MTLDIWSAILVCALGTFAMRLFPLIWMQIHLAKKAKQNSATNNTPVWISVLGPVMIAAMFGASLMPVRADWIGAASTVIAVIATLICWQRYRTLGKPVFCGVFVFGVTTYLLSYLSSL